MTCLTRYRLRCEPSVLSLTAGCLSAGRRVQSTPVEIYDNSGRVHRGGLVLGKMNNIQGAPDRAMA
jgi:hypothetical protein